MGIEILGLFISLFSIDVDAIKFPNFVDYQGNWITNHDCLLRHTVDYLFKIFNTYHNLCSFSTTANITKLFHKIDITGLDIPLRDL